MMNVFLDSDVILDFLLKRAPFAEAAGMIFSLGERGLLTLCTSTLSFMNVLYIAGAATDRATARSLGRRLRVLMEQLPVDSAQVDAALASAARDVEDYVQYTVARENTVDYLVTRNVDDYPREGTFIVTPDVFLTTLPR